MNASYVIRAAETPEDYTAFATLIRAYVEWCRERYSHDQWVLETAFGYQSLDAELERLPAAYGPPAGKTLLATDGDNVLGAVAYRKLAGDICEMKRMFVFTEHSGRGIGRALCQALLDHARADGFTLMRLDTARDMREAIALYRSNGFAPCEPYIDYPERLKPMILFMDRAL